MGDLNNDGYDDVGLAAVDVVSSSSGLPIATSLNVYFGQSDLPNLALSDPDLAYFGTSALKAIAGDFDGNGDRDLAVFHRPDEILIYDDVPALLIKQNFTTQDATTRVNLARNMKDVAGANLDLNGDNIDDLAFNAFLAESYTVYGSHGRVDLPETFDVLENVSVPGSGSFVTDRGTGRPVLFNEGGSPFRILDDEAWFQFTTLGDGQTRDEWHCRVLT